MRGHIVTFLPLLSATSGAMSVCGPNPNTCLSMKEMPVIQLPLCASIALHIVLASREIPHKITPIHVVHLVGE